MKNLTKISIFIICVLQTAVCLGQECRDDRDCNYLEFCFKTNFCAKCEDCSGFYRQNGRDICSRTPQQCGDCLPGYMENIEHVRYDGERATYCIKATNIPSSTLSSGADETSKEANGNEDDLLKILIIVIPTISAIFFIILAAYLFFTRYCPKEFTARIMQSFGIISETNVPQNAENMPLSTPSAPPYAHDIPVKENPPSYSQVQFENENRHNAVMERRPNYVSETDIPDDNLVENNEENNNNRNNPVLVVEENTQPSNWTPEPRNETTPPARTTFAGCLSLPSQESQEPRPERQSTRRPADPEPRPSKRQRGSDVNVNVSTQHISQQSSQNNIINVINLGRMPHHFSQATGGTTQTGDFPHMNTTHMNTTHLTLPTIRSGANRGAQGNTIIQSQTEQSSSSFNRNLDHPSSSQDCVPYSNNDTRNIHSPTASIRRNSSDDDELND